MTRFTVRLFARYAELFAAQQVDVVLATPATVGALIEALRQLPGGESLPAVPFVAVNMAQSTSSAILATTDEIALLPPLAGG